ncbi:pyridoxal phosphate-dependent aminotransferase [Nonomuraea sp. NPDC047897]|uniref:pyridoxal phosphate-dependent aminotransferase n=1 Tax=Nonomuraea sp. NPDC047897 TaxID=3364346 RepID=UPI00371AA0C8
MTEETAMHDHGRQIRMDLNESPVAIDDSSAALLADVLRTANRYPRGVLQRRLTHVIAQRNGCAPENVVLGAGSVSLLEAVWSCTVDPGDPVVFAEPGFEMYPWLTVRRGGTPMSVPLAPGFRTDLKQIRHLVRTARPALVAITNPHNPSGTRCPDAELTSFLAEVRTDTVVVVDEAYVDFDERADLAASAAAAVDAPNVVLTRTLSKAHGLAGLRIGYAIAHADLARRLAASTLPFAVTDVACAAASAAMDTVDDKVARIRAMRASLTEQLRDLGLEVPDSAANFVLVVGHHDLADRLADRGVLVSRSPLGVRITIGHEQGGDRVVEGVREYCAARHGSSKENQPTGRQ